MYYNPIEAGRRISKLRQSRNLKQEAFAEHFGTTDRHIRRIEKGDTAPSIDLFVEMSLYFGASLDYLIIGVNVSEREELLRNQLHKHHAFQNKLKEIVKGLTESLESLEEKL